MELDPQQEILQQLKKLNYKLDKMTDPWKNAWSNFLYGVFRALGYIFGTAIIAASILYIASQLTIGKNIINWFETYQPTNIQISKPSSD